VDNFDEWFFSAILEATKKAGRENEITEANIGKIMKEAVPKTADLLLEKLKTENTRMLKERRAYARDFEKRLYMRWKKPIDLLEMFLEISLEFGAEFNERHRAQAAKCNDFLFDVLTRQHARACQIGFEILALLKSGLADGAFARWRTLHEIVVVSCFIRDQGNDLAKRFMQYEIMEAYKQARVYQKYCRRLGYEPLTDKEMRQLDELRSKILETYGKDFGDEYGWIPKEILRNRNLMEIEKIVKLDHLRPFYRMACYGVHAGPKGIKSPLGLFHETSKEPLLLAGPSNYGLADPGQSMALSLYQLTTCLLLTKPTIENLISSEIMQKLVHELSIAFVAVQSKIAEEEKRIIAETKNTA